MSSSTGTGSSKQPSSTPATKTLGIKTLSRSLREYMSSSVRASRPPSMGSGSGAGNLQAPPWSAPEEAAINTATEIETALLDDLENTQVTMLSELILKLFPDMDESAALAQDLARSSIEEMGMPPQRPANLPQSMSPLSPEAGSNPISMSYLNSGCHGKVFLSRNRLLNNLVVVKRIRVKTAKVSGSKDPQSYMNSLLSEVTAHLRANSHMNVVKLFNWWVERDQPVSEDPVCLNILMEALPGSLVDLYDAMGNEIMQSKPTLWCILGQAIQAVMFLHSVGVTHGDINARNVLVDINPAISSAGGQAQSAQGEVSRTFPLIIKIMDFGSSRVLKPKSKVRLLKEPSLYDLPLPNPVDDEDPKLTSDVSVFEWYERQDVMSIIEMFFGLVYNEDMVLKGTGQICREVFTNPLRNIPTCKDTDGNNVAIDNRAEELHLFTIAGFDQPVGACADSDDGTLSGLSLTDLISITTPTMRKLRCFPDTDPYLSFLLDYLQNANTVTTAQSPVVNNLTGQPAVSPVFNGTPRGAQAVAGTPELNVVSLYSGKERIADAGIVSFAEDVINKSATERLEMVSSVVIFDMTDLFKKAQGRRGKVNVAGSVPYDKVLQICTKELFLCLNENKVLFGMDGPHTWIERMIKAMRKKAKNLSKFTTAVSLQHDNSQIQALVSRFLKHIPKSFYEDLYHTTVTQVTANDNGSGDGHCRAYVLLAPEEQALRVPSCSVLMEI